MIMKTIFSFILYFILRLSHSNSYIDTDYNIPPFIRQALYDLYTSTNGSGWIYKEGARGHWNFNDSNVNPCSAHNRWQGLNCSILSSVESTNYSYISDIRLPYYNLVGSIPYSIGNLTHLQSLNLSHNSIKQIIPNTIGNLSELIELDLSQNSLTGTIPDSIYNLSKLKILNLNNTLYLDGTLSSLIAKLSQLQVLLLGYNVFKGSLPNTIGSLSGLLRLDIAHNTFSGTIPESMFNLSDLQILNLDSNYDLYGTLSNSIGNLSNLQYLNLRYNKFYGTIPDSIGSLSKLTYLRGTKNQLTGTIPNSVCNLILLNLFTFSYNKISGTIPKSIGKLSKLTFFGIYSNYITGTIPSSISNMTDLFLFDLGRNQLTGIVPIWLGELTSLKTIYLNNNIMTGNIPSCLYKLQMLEEIYFDSNFLIGTIPNIFSSLYALNILQFDGNYLTGTLPVSIAQLSNLAVCFLQNNYLSGKLYNVFSGKHQKKLLNIQLSYNEFTGNLPVELFESNTLLAFSAVSNCFHGSIPSTICDNTDLVSLALDGLVCASPCRKKIISTISDAYINDNDITGGIPKCLWSMPNLTVLHLSGNELTGSLPDNIKLGNALNDLSLSYNLLTGSIPTYIQERQWINLDLSHNRFSGTFRSNFQNQPSNTSITLKVNRLSGNIPNNLQNIKNISILEGNIFDCKYDRSDLPKNEDDKDIYECGSNIFNVFYYIWLGFLSLLISVFLFLWYYRNQLVYYIRLSLILHKISKWIYIWDYFKNNEIENYSIENNTSYIRKYFIIHDHILNYTLYCTSLIILLLLPTYLSVCFYYNTHTYEYAWTFSLLYLSGETAFWVIMATLLIFMTIHTYIFQYGLYRNRHIFDNLKEEIIDKKEVDEVTIDKEESDRVIIDTTEIMNNILKSKSSNNWMIYSMYLLYTSINFLIVGGVNIAYVYIVLYQSSSVTVLAQILLSIFKMFWNNFISPKMVYWIIKYLSLRNIVTDIIQIRLFVLQLVVSLLNNIMIPCIIVIIISPNCFYHVFDEESEVKSSFAYLECVIINQSGSCETYEVIQSTTSYSPPFIYSYQCSADFITYYASVFVFICIISTFIIPFLQIVVLNLSNKYKWISKYIKISKLFHLDNSEISKISSRLLNIDDIYEILVSLLTLVGLLLTFGVVFPPLAVAIFITICRRIYFHKFIIGRYISYALEQKSYVTINILNEDCKLIELISTTIHVCGWVLLFISCLFYTLFLFDILGDDLGVTEAYWVFIVIPCLPICIYLLYKIYINYFIQHIKYDKDCSISIKHTSKSIDGIELLPSSSSSSLSLGMMEICNPLSNTNPSKLYVDNMLTKNNNSISDEKSITHNINQVNKNVYDIYVDDREGKSIIMKHMSVDSTM